MESEYGMPMDDAELDRIGQFSEDSPIALGRIKVLWGARDATKARQERWRKRRR